MITRKTVRKLLILISALLVFFAACEIFTSYIFNRAFGPVKSINAPDAPDFIVSKRKPYKGDDPVEILNQKLKDENYPWLKENSNVVTIKSFDNLTLNAYFLKNHENHLYALVMHGYHDFPKTVSPYAKHFNELGFNVLVPGERGHGWSDGNHVEMSAFTPYDVKSWVEFICGQDKAAQILLWGVSMGGSTVMRATALELPENVICCIEDCGFSSAWDEYVYQLEHFYHIPGIPVMSLLNRKVIKDIGFDCKKVSAKDDLKNSKIPTLFIHGSGDTYVPFYMLDEVYNAAACPKEKLVIEGAEHARSMATNPELYWKTTDAFLRKYFTLD